MFHRPIVNLCPVYIYIFSFCDLLKDISADVKYTKDHEWVEIDRLHKIATVGITEFAQKALGDIVFVELPQIGSIVNANGYN